LTPSSFDITHTSTFLKAEPIVVSVRDAKASLRLELADVVALCMYGIESRERHHPETSPCSLHSHIRDLSRDNESRGTSGRNGLADAGPQSRVPTGALASAYYPRKLDLGDCALVIRVKAHRGDGDWTCFIVDYDSNTRRIGDGPPSPVHIASLRYVIRDPPVIRVVIDIPSKGIGDEGDSISHKSGRGRGSARGNLETPFRRRRPVVDERVLPIDERPRMVKTPRGRLSETGKSHEITGKSNDYSVYWLSVENLDDIGHERIGAPRITVPVSTDREPSDLKSKCVRLGVARREVAGSRER
jgi:hypothetical protein